ncbi:MAG: hypothetical protein LAT68_04960 [Cyclobacteriaceae bacterium]|nr:hypothetical protein [Cyclobacteriaceae bacterium]MCH8515662.1 hypothetical protein [Cyclobacteriaceae bacterium]
MENQISAVAIESLSDSSRVWVYQMDRSIDESEVNLLSELMDEFIANWKAHGKPLRATFQIIENRFLVVAADEDYHAASGCSIDASVHFIEEIGKKLNLNFFDRQHLIFLNGGETKQVKISELKSAVADGLIKKDTIIYNSMLSTVGDFKQKWKVAAKNSWLQRYFS